MYGVKETACTNCGHRPVCSKSVEFILAQKAIDDVSVCARDDGGLEKVRDMDWLTVELRCRHYITNQTLRKGPSERTH